MSIPLTIPPGSTARLAFTFAPAAAGAAAGSATIVSNAAGSPHIVPLTGTGEGVVPEPTMRWLTVDGALIREAGTNAPFRFKAANWYGGSAAGLVGDGLWGRPYKSIGDGQGVNKGLLEEARDLGINAIRYLVCQDITWPGRKPAAETYIDYTLNPDLFEPDATPENAWPNKILPALDILDKIVAHAKTLGLRIILDMHCAAPNTSNDLGLGYKWYTTETPDAPGATTGATGEPRNEEQMLAAWEAFAAHYANEPTVCAFDLINEPMETTWDEDPERGILGFYNRCVARIRAVNTKALIICEGSFLAWNEHFQQYTVASIEVASGISVGVQASGDLRGVRDNPVQDPQGLVVYSPHEYGSYFPGYTDATNGNVYRNYMLQDGYDTGQAYALLDEVWTAWWGWMVKENRHPVFVGEIGTWFNTTSANYSGVAVPYTTTNKAKDELWLAAFDEWMRRWHQSFAFWALNPGGEPDGLLMPEVLPAAGEPVPGDGVWRNTIYPYKQPIVDLFFAAEGPFVEPPWEEGPTEPYEFSWVTAQGRKLYNEQGQQIILRSIGWYSLEQDNYIRGTSNRPLVTRDIITNDDALANGVTTPAEREGILNELKRIGFNSIRVPVSQHTIKNLPPQGIPPQPPNYQGEPLVNPDFFRGYLGGPVTEPGEDEANWKAMWNTSTWAPYAANPPWWVQDGGVRQPLIGGLDLLDQLVAAAKEVGLYIILDMHCLARNNSNEQGTHGKWYTTTDRLDPGQDAGAVGEVRNEQQMLDAWAFFANRYKDEPTVAFFDILNEPFNCTWDAGEEHLDTNVRAFYERCAKVIMDINPKVFLWFEGIHGRTYVNGVLEEYYAMPFPALPNQAHIGIQFASNLTGVRNAPVVVRNSAGTIITGKHGYSPHYYGPSENPLNLYNGTIGSTPAPEAMLIWIEQMWGYIPKELDQPVWIGEWAAKFLADRGIPGMDATWAARDLDYLNVLSTFCKQWDIGHAYWAVNADENQQNGMMLGNDFGGYTGHDVERRQIIAPMFED